MPRKIGSKCPHSQATKDKIRSKAIGRKLSAEHAAKLTFKGRKHNEESKRKIGNGNRKPKSPQGRANIGESIRKRPKPTKPSPLIGRKHSQSHKDKISAGGKGKKRSPETKARMSESLKQNPRKRSVEGKKSASEKMQRWWATMPTSEKEERLRKFKLASEKSIGPRASQYIPNNLERRVEAYLNEHFPGEWRFNNGDFVISGFVPDFVNINGRKAVIEVFGDFWHRGENPKRKQAIYRKCGFSCIVIWKSEFKTNPNQLFDLLKQQQLLNERGG